MGWGGVRGGWGDLAAAAYLCVVTRTQAVCAPSVTSDKGKAWRSLSGTTVVPAAHASRHTAAASEAASGGTTSTRICPQGLLRLTSPRDALGCTSDLFADESDIRSLKPKEYYGDCPRLSNCPADVKLPGHATRSTCKGPISGQNHRHAAASYRCSLLPGITKRRFAAVVGRQQRRLPPCNSIQRASCMPARASAQVMIWPHRRCYMLQGSPNDQNDH